MKNGIYKPRDVMNLTAQSPKDENVEVVFQRFVALLARLVRQLKERSQTFKATCDYADLSAPLDAGGSTGKKTLITSGGVGTGAKTTQAQGEPAIHIDLHIHLPENKSRRDYEYIFEDIGKYILGRTQPPPADE